ncbi:patatin-like phospholipase domain-containing protein [Psychroserpens damuponensis]|uniref:hypothetical protein n=1 Tax=Psychroserpens damuponensis TaxID=943936 RepID=UPI001269ADDA|nr:hypothetical protein [Psychroserpens damuponensis]
MSSKVLKYMIYVVIFQSCATKKYINKHQISEDISSATENIYSIKNDKKELIKKTYLDFTNNGRINESQTFDGNNNLIEKTEKRLWFIKKSFPNKEPYYCKTRWKPNQRERISCYSQKRYKQNEVIVHYNKNGTINTVVDNFTNFETHYFSYTNNELSNIIIKNKNGVIIEEILVTCVEKDQKGTCIDQIKTYTKTDRITQTILKPFYKAN